MAAKKKLVATIETENGTVEETFNPETASTRVEIKPVPIEKARIKIIGDTPLLVHAWSEKAKKEMLANQQMSAREKKVKEHDKREPFADFVEAAYWITPQPEVRGLPEEKQIKLFEDAIENGAQFGFPVIAFKQATILACKDAGFIRGTTIMRRLFHVNAVNGAHVRSSQELAILNIEEPPELSEDVVKIGLSKVADLRYRPSFRKWSVELELSLIKTGMFEMSDIITAIDMAGFMNGVGEWRIEKNGEFGCFHVAREGE